MDPRNLFYDRKMSERTYLRTLRYIVQAGFFILTLWIGYRFYQFLLYFESPGNPFVQRPPAVDSFLPIAGLMSFKYFLFTGIIEPIHPAAFVMFVAIITTSLIMKKGFCGWICPIGTISQVLWMAGEKVVGKNFRMEKYTDISLRLIKYALMALFLLLIGVAMAPNMMVLFFLSDYYKIADVKTMKFFTDISTTSLLVISAIAGLSLIYKNFWCRYLCPYGALLGLLSRLSPFKVRRSETDCTHCRACSRNCPSLIDVEKKTVVKSPECFGCLTCLSHCPSRGALDITMGAGKKRRIMTPYIFPLILVLIFYLIIGAGMLGGKWQSRLSPDEYRIIIPAVSEQNFTGN